MNNANKKVSLFFVTAALPFAAFSEPPTNFGNWSAVGGQISAACPDQFTCAPVVGDSGFLQRQITNANGETFLQSIITDPNANGAPATLGFATEDFVRMGGGNTINGGIAARQFISEGDAFKNTFEMTRGWAAPTGSSGTGHTSQTMSDIGNPNIQTDDFTSSFGFDGIMRNGVGTGRQIEIDQTLGLNQGGTEEINDWQAMSMTVVMGEFQTTDGGANFPGIGTISWTSDDSVMAGWVGQVFDETAPNRGGMGGAFGHGAVMNMSSGDAIVINSLTDPGPFDWSNPPFGDVPFIPVVTKP